MRIVVNDIGTNYQLNGRGTPLTLIHALGLDHNLWRRQTLNFSAGHRLLRYDLRGHGQTDVPPGPYSLDMLAEDLYGLLVSLGIQRTDLLGLSLGGMVAQTFVLAHPEMVDRLILANTTSEYGPEARSQYEGMAQFAETQGVEELLAGAMQIWFTPAFQRSNPRDVEEIREIGVRMDPVGFAAINRAAARLDLTGRLSEIHSPTLVLAAADDPGTPPALVEQIHRAIPGSRFDVIPDAAHLSNVEQPALFNAAVLGFLDR